MIPSVVPERGGRAVVEASWITVKTPKAFYGVGEQLDVSVPVTESKRMNYMVSPLIIFVSKTQIDHIGTKYVTYL